MLYLNNVRYVLVFIGCIFGLVGTLTCPNRDVPMPPALDLSVPKDHNGVNALLASARSTRRDILNHEIPYSRIRDEISKIYNMSSLRVSPFVNEWIKFAENSLYLAGFIIFVGVILPLVMVTLWTFWECCYEVEEEDEEECRNESFFAQVVAWTLAIAIVISLVVLTAFVAILLTGNSIVTNGVVEGGEAVSVVLPEVKKIRDEAVEGVEVAVLEKYRNLLDDIYSNTLGSIPGRIQSDVRDMLGIEIERFYSNVSQSLSLNSSIRTKAEFLVNRTHDLALSNNDLINVTSSDVSHLLDHFKAALNSLKNSCSDFLSLNQSSTRDLNDECEALVSLPRELYIPVISSDIRYFGGMFNTTHTLLQRMVELLTSREFSKEPVIDHYSVYIEEMSQNLTLLINSTSNDYFGRDSTFYRNLTALMDEILSINSSLTLGLPSSQEEVLTFLGPRYLSNWDEFRSTCTIAFALTILIMGICLVVSIARGLYNIFDLHVHGEDPSNLEGTHQSGRALKKLSFMMTGVCILSAIFYGVSLVIAGGIGQSCHPHGNFSELLRLVIDDNRTWRGTHLLGLAIHGNRSYPLTFKSVLDDCRLNLSLYTSLKLGDRFNLEQDIGILDEDKELYQTRLKGLTQNISPLNILSACAQDQLDTLIHLESFPVDWSNFTSLTLNATQLFNPMFIGVEKMYWKLQNMREALMLASPHLSSNVSNGLAVQLEETATSFSNLVEYINSTVLPPLRDSATYLQHSLGVNSFSSLNTEGTRLQNRVRLLVSKRANTHVVVGAVIVNFNLSTYITNTIHALKCEIGSCHSLFRLYQQFSSAVCQDLVPGMDLYWSSLMTILVLSLCIMVLSFFLTSRFIDLKQEQSNKVHKFHISSFIIRQTRAMLWFLLSISINLWLVVAVSQDTHFRDVCSSRGCCPSCVWIFGIVFLILTFIVGGTSRLYQCHKLHRLSRAIKKVRRYWIAKKKAAQFYGQLAILVIQDIPFLILAGVYTSQISTLTIPSFFSLAISLLGIASYLIYILRERNSIIDYFLCLKSEFKQSSKFNVQEEPSPGNSRHGTDGHALAMNGRALNGRYLGSESEQSESDSQGTTQPVEDWMYNSNNVGNHGEHRLSVIPEHMEGLEDMATHQVEELLSLPGPMDSIAGGVAMGRRGMNMMVPVYMHTQDSDSEVQHTASMGLDRTDSPTESALQQRRTAADRGEGGIEVASIRNYDTSSLSYFGSKTSIGGSDFQGYYSSSLPPDDLYESSDYREDCDSDYSNAPRHRLRLRLNNELSCEMSVEV